MPGAWDAPETNTKQQPNITMPIIPMLAEITGNVHIAMAALGAGLGIGILGAKAAEATGRNPGASTPILVNAIIFAALAEGVFILSAFAVK
jgi:F-type H+-transporting ATPase subunit c